VTQYSAGIHKETKKGLAGQIGWIDELTQQATNSTIQDEHCGNKAHDSCHL
jgi:hypothetical protein